MDREKEIIRLFPAKLKGALQSACLDYDNIRANRPVQIIGGSHMYYLSGSGNLTSREELGYVVTKEELRETMELAGNYSLYAYEEELREGFLTVEGGHRIGVAGKVIYDGRRILGMKYITSVNAHDLTAGLWKNHAAAGSDPSAGRGRGGGTGVYPGRKCRGV